MGIKVDRGPKASGLYYKDILVGELFTRASDTGYVWLMADTGALCVRNPKRTMPFCVHFKFDQQHKDYRLFEGTITIDNEIGEL